MPKLGIMLFTAALGLVGSYALRDFSHVAVTKNVAFEEALGFSNGKGIINIGAGPHRTPQAQAIAEHPQVLANLDITPNGMQNFVEINLEQSRLPFADKQFGCGFASHVLEHLDNWEFALEEVCRVADDVVVVLPDPKYVSGWICPSHRQYFTREDMYQMTQVYHNVTVYF